MLLGDEGLSFWRRFPWRAAMGTESPVLIRLTSQSKKIGLNLPRRRARFAFVSLRPVLLDLGV
jgi:hypothetical protein